MQRPLAVAALGVHERRIGREEAAQPVGHVELRRRPDVDLGAAFDQRRHLLGRCILQNPEAAHLPRRFRIDVGAVRDEQIEHGEVAHGELDRGLLEVEQRLVDTRDKLGMRAEQRAHAIDIAGPDRVAEKLHRRLGQRIDLVLELRPAFEAVAACDDQLGIGERERVGRRRLRVQRLDARHRSRVAAPVVERQCLGEFSLLVEIGFRRQWFDEALRGRVAGGFRHD